MINIVNYILGLKFLAKVAEFDPALARAVEISIYSILAYCLSLMLAGQSLVLSDVMGVALVPLLAYFGKIQRDLEKKKEELTNAENSVTYQYGKTSAK